jgi:RNA polymerase sigma factor (sigma-70 family)
MFLFERQEIQTALAAMVLHLARHAAERDDFLQEARLHLWQIEPVHPHESVSWYQESCRLRLKNWMRHGRSLDSPKRAHLRSQRCDSGEKERWPTDATPDAEAPFAADIPSQVAANDFLERLIPRLSRENRTILQLRLEGCTDEEIAAFLGISRRAV